MGFQKEIVGVSYFCPLDLPKIADLKINLEEVLKLKPTAVFMLSSQAKEKDIKILKKLNIKYASYSFETLRNIPFCAQEMAKLLGKEETGKKHFKDFMSKIKNLPKLKKQNVIYVLWWDPLILSTSSSYISEVLNFMGFNVYPKNDNKDFERSNIESIFTIKPDLILISDDSGKIPEIIGKHFKTFLIHSEIVNRPDLNFINYFMNFKNENIFN